MSNNDITLGSYDDHVQEYVEGTPSVVDGGRQKMLDDALAKLPKGAAILELGSGFGRDADYIESKGYIVIRTDASKGFVDLLKKQGHEAHLLNALTDDFGKDRDMIFANAVLLHFNREDCKRVIEKAHSSLRPDGMFVFTMKQGDGEAWTKEKLGAPRYFCYWQPEELKQAVLSVGFKDVLVSSEQGGTATWIKVVATK